VKHQAAGGEESLTRINITQLNKHKIKMEQFLTEYFALIWILGMIIIFSSSALFAHLSTREVKDHKTKKVKVVKIRQVIKRIAAII
jgi:hypothetical protein